MEIKLDGVLYFWNGRGWTDKDGVVPPLSIRQRLNQLAAPEISAADATIHDPSELTKLAQKAIEAGEQSRAIALALRAFQCDPHNEGRAATLVSVLRKAHRPDEAIPILNAFPQARFGPLLTTLAALLCDLERWEEALAMTRRALGAGNSGEAWNVWHRINKARPDLTG